MFTPHLSLVLLLAASVVVAVEKPGDIGDPLQWLRDSIPGEPGVDYPIYSSVPESSFSCDGRVFGGYYADIDLGCQAYHICLLDPLAGKMNPTSFLCPNGTIFQQHIFNCDWWYNVDCARSESLYGLAQGAFGSNPDGGNGECPAVDPSSDCSGALPSDCWSPGQGDTDCLNFGLCCFDGCSNRCVGEGGQQTAEVAPQPQYGSPAIPIESSLPQYGAPSPKGNRRGKRLRKRKIQISTINDKLVYTLL